MATFLVVLLAVTALAVCAIREDTPTARTPARILADLRTAGWLRIAALTVYIPAGAMACALYAALRTGLYGALLAVAAVSCWGASLASMDQRPVRIHRLEIAR